ncbi:hypothetical protein GO988_23550 [Hymenobacter sp. HMF4947]|uniref:Uncharacterized protein n=1 Tax=Hymenobacter ginkgonis TaxID=2682976 RepID=A0A7K1TLM8_9BACT|nr:hypothetical protein [Hymenobacter ginkgonis]MVN79319.1 hypothetical protein [Hymenobacter ginkgonis]
MALTKFKLVNTEGLTGLQYKGKKIPFDKIDDELAETLIKKTHVLERVAPEPATVPVVLALAEPAAEAEPTAPRRARSAQ